VGIIVGGQDFLFNNPSEGFSIANAFIILLLLLSSILCP
jgi:hypothetical protein